MNKSNAYLFFWKANFMYVGRGIPTAIHDHHAVQVIIDLDGSFELKSPSEVNKKCRAVLIDSDKPHECITREDIMLILNIAPESVIGANLKSTYLNYNGFKSINNTLTDEFIKNISNSLKQEIDEHDVIAITETYLYQLSKAAVPHILDDRIIQVLDILNQLEWGTIKIKDIAARVFISESRLIHLFTEQVGVPIRKYILWLRLVTAIQRTFQDNNITQAALDAGFSDAPHFNKTLKRMFGLNLSNLRNSQFIQAWWL